MTWRVSLSVERHPSRIASHPFVEMNSGYVNAILLHAVHPECHFLCFPLDDPSQVSLVLQHSRWQITPFANETLHNISCIVCQGECLLDTIGPNAALPHFAGRVLLIKSDYGAFTAQECEAIRSMYDLSLVD